MSGERKALVIYLILTVASLRARPARPDRAGPRGGLCRIASCSRRLSRTRICRSRSARSSIPAAPATTNTCSPRASICRAIRRATSNAPLPCHVSRPDVRRASALRRRHQPVRRDRRRDVSQPAPEELRLEIHGEFQRILTENGLVGLSLYSLVWAAAWARLSRVLRGAASTADD